MSGRSRLPIITALGCTQIFAWGSSYYLPAILAQPIALDTGWSLTYIAAGLSVGLLTAGLVSPWVGSAIDQRGGKSVLIASAFLIAAGQLTLALAHDLWTYFTAWAIVGVGMGAGLYESAFSTLGRLYGQQARSAITIVMLFGGFASTVCWPLSTFLLLRFGWRATCAIYAAIQLAGAVPIYLLILPDEKRQKTSAVPIVHAVRAVPAGPDKRRFVELAAVITLNSIISTALSVQLLAILQARGMSLTTSVALGALVGPLQVSARFVQMLVPRRYHPIWTNLAATGLVMGGLLVLIFGGSALPAALALYGAGMGLASIARGTIPLAIYGPMLYPQIMGRIAMPNLLGQAIAPYLSQVIVYSIGYDDLLSILLLLSILGFIISNDLYFQISTLSQKDADSY